MPFQSPVSSNFVNSRFDDKSTGRHVRIKPFWRVACNNCHRTGSKPVWWKLKFESPFPFIAVAILQNKFPLLGSWDEAALGCCGSVSRLRWIIEPKRIFSGFFVLRFESGLATSPFAVVEEIRIVAFLRVVLVILQHKNFEKKLLAKN